MGSIADKFINPGDIKEEIELKAILEVGLIHLFSPFFNYYFI